MMSQVNTILRAILTSLSAMRDPSRPSKADANAKGLDQTIEDAND